MDIIERRPGFSDEMMYRQCLLLAGIVNRKTTIKQGRGRNTYTLEVDKFKTSKHDIDRINRSVEYYKNLMENRKKSVELRDYQKKISQDACVILRQHRFVYLAMEVRTGKTLTSLSIADLMGCKKVLFVTKKKAISSIKGDYDMLSPDYYITVINYESLHAVLDTHTYDMIILDEAHSMGAIPKPSKRAKQVRDIISKSNPYVILLSGTPTPESYAQMYHQVYGIKTNPFSKYKNFYRFCDDHVDVRERKINGLSIKDYTGGKESIIEAMSRYTISYTQAEAGFKVNTREHILEVEMKEMTYKLISRLKKDLVIEGKGEVILADTPVKLMTKIHQLCSGTIKFESGNSAIIDLSKAEFIKEKFYGKKIGIFYKFKEEYNAIVNVFGKENVTSELSVFSDTDCPVIALQIISGREGISLKEADALVYYNIDFSATSYWQSRDRMTTKDRLESDVYWIFSKGGIEKDIYKAVSSKKDFTLRHFKKIFNTEEK